MTRKEESGESSVERHAADSLFAASGMNSVIEAVDERERDLASRGMSSVIQQYRDERDLIFASSVIIPSPRARSLWHVRAPFPPHALFPLCPNSFPLA